MEVGAYVDVCLYMHTFMVLNHLGVNRLPASMESTLAGLVCLMSTQS